MIHNSIKPLSIALLLFTYFLNAQESENNEKLDAMIVQGMKDWKIPGLATIVVKDGQVVFQKTYGVKNLETKEPVNENTLFNMASTTKAIIAIALGMLVDDGKLNWDDKVVEHLPSFKLSDSYITADARVKDLLTHNLGIGNADLLWVIDSVSTQQTLRKFRFAKAAYPIRGGFTYQNIMYAVAGELIEVVSGKHWTEFVKERVFTPLGMSRTQAKSGDIIQAGDYATPYYDDPEDGMVRVGHTFSDQIGAAGMIWSSPKDVSNYLTFLVNDGVYKSDTLVKPATFEYLFEPHSFLGTSGIYPTNALTNPNWNTYGLGWFQQDYRGHKLDFHTGSIAGLVAIAGIVHDKNIAVYVFANLDHAELRHAIMYKAIDLYGFDDDSRDWHTEVFELYSGFKKEAKTAREKHQSERAADTKPSLPLSAYLGEYRHKMLGKVMVSLIGDNLQIDFNDYVNYTLRHWHHNTFRTNKDPKWRDRFMIRFDLNNDGKVAALDFVGKAFIKAEETDD
ncbi:MAG: serine hydrolase [Aurantibacter sp.]